MGKLVAVANDHAGCGLKKIIVEHLTKEGLVVTDLGLSDDQGKGDYPDYAQLVAEEILRGKVEGGILICGTGQGMAMAANRIKGIRAALCTNEFLAQQARAHNNANILTLGARVTGEALALAIVDQFLKTPFEGGRHQIRLDKIDNMGEGQT